MAAFGTIKVANPDRSELEPTVLTFTDQFWFFDTLVALKAAGYTVVDSFWGYAISDNRKAALETIAAVLGEPNKKG